MIFFVCFCCILLYLPTIFCPFFCLFWSSCNPNCDVQAWNIAGYTRLGIYATKDLVKGESLSYDYKARRKGVPRFTSGGGGGGDIGEIVYPIYYRRRVSSLPRTHVSMCYVLHV